MDKTTKVFTRANAKHWPANLGRILRDYWKNSEKDLRVTVEEDTETRRDKQNKLMWLWHGELSGHIFESRGERFSSDDIHEHITNKLLPKRVINIDQEPIIVRTQTSKLKVREFADFLNEYFALVDIKYNLVFSRPEDLYLQAVMKNDK